MNSIRRQLALRILIGFGLLLILSSLAIYFLTRAAFLEEFDSGLKAKAQLIMSLTQQGRDGIQVDLADAIFPGTDVNLNSVYFEIWQTNGTPIARSESLNHADLPLKIGSAVKPDYWNVDLPDDHDGRAVGLRFTPKVEDEDAKHLAQTDAIIVVAADSESVDHTLDTLALVLVATGFLTIFITVPIVRFSLQRGLAPLEQLSKQAATITVDTLKTRFQMDSMPEELKAITSRLNDLLRRLEESFERERRFSADLAHELRTPLAELRSLAEVELAWPEGGNLEKYRETLNIALQMEAMVNRLLELARSETGRISLQLESVVIASLLEEAWRPFAAKAKTKGLAFVFDGPADAALETDRTLFRSILTNLLANAVEYTPENGHGKIQWDPRACRLTINNTVHDLTAADLPHLFERLWRKDKSRTGGDHYGLGLVVCRTFAELLGMELKAELTNETTLSISLLTNSKS